MPVTPERIADRLNDLSIPYEEELYENRYRFWQALEVYPDTKEDPPHPVLALTVKSGNGKKHISVVFEYIDDRYEFCDLFFGPFDYEFFNLEEDIVEESIIETTAAIMNNETAIIFAVDPEREKWLWDGSFDIGSLDPHDRYEFEQMVKKIERPKKGLSKLLNRQVRYEVYDWNTYRRIEN